MSSVKRTTAEQGRPEVQAAFAEYLERIDRGEATPMDIEIVAGVQENIIGNCLCVLGDSMAMPIGSMIKHFRPEFEAHIEAARERADRAAAVGEFSAVELAASAHAGPGVG